MALTRVETQVTWSAANSAVLSSGGSLVSDDITLDATCVKARIMCKADNSSGTPASGDQVLFQVIETHGDPDGSGADEFSSEDSVHPLRLGEADTVVTDPALFSEDYPVPQKIGRLRVSSVGASNNITVSATITELRSS